MVVGGWANPLQTLSQGLVLTWRFTFGPELDNISQYNYVAPHQAAEDSCGASQSSHTSQAVWNCWRAGQTVYSWYSWFQNTFDWSRNIDPGALDVRVRGATLPASMATPVARSRKWSRPVRKPGLRCPRTTSRTTRYFMTMTSGIRSVTEKVLWSSDNYSLLSKF